MKESLSEKIKQEIQFRLCLLHKFIPTYAMLQCAEMTTE